MRIAYVSADFGVPVFGTKGASIHVRELARALALLGHEVLILTPRAGGDPPPSFGVLVREIPIDGAEGLRREERAIRYSALLRERALPLLRDFRPDLVYERYSLFATGGASLADALAIPHVVEVNAPLSDEQAEHRGLALPGTARALEREVLRSAARIVAVSSWLERWLIGLGVERHRIAVVPNGVDPARFDLPIAERDAARAQLGLAGESVVGFLGTLKPWHDVATLLRAVARLRRDDLAPRLLIVGDGPERTRLEDLARREGIAAATTFTGPVPHDRVPSYLAALDVAVAPYARRDDFYFSPLKLVEYLAAARPVVAADIGDLGHCIRPGRTGLLYPPGDVSALAAATRELLEDPASAARLGEAGRDHVRTHHTWEGNARSVVDFARAELELRRAC